LTSHAPLTTDAVPANEGWRVEQQGAPRFAPGHADWQAARAQAASWTDAVAAVKGPFSVVQAVPGGAVRMAVDRFAQETLCYRLQGAQLDVAERADAWGGHDLDPQAIYDYLFFHMIPAPRTIFRGVHRLPAGHAAEFDGQQLVLSRHDALRFRPQASKDADFEALKHEFKGLLTQAVQRTLTPGVPACFLSGGTDSSTVTGLIKQQAGAVHTYSIGFDAEGYDEMAYARLTAQHFGSTHHAYYVTPDDLVQHIPTAAAAYDQPFGNSSALPAYCCALRAREDGVSTMLAGDGGDELFGGNTRYAEQRVFAPWAKVPGWVQKGLIEPALAWPGADRVSVMRKGRNYVRAAKAGLPRRLHDYNLLLRLGVETVLDPAFLRGVDPSSVFAQTDAVWRLADATHDLDRMLAYDWRYTLADSDVPKVRGTSRLAGVRVTYPFLDDDLVSFSKRLPADYKVRGDQLRWFFKEALRGFLPDAVITKSKKGFGLPFGVWVLRHEGLRRLTSDALRSVATRGVVNPRFVDDLMSNRLAQHPGYYGEMVWILMMLEHWLRAHAPSWRYQA
jgi:asparagine synthase (glutamine-hydrolysing)